MEDVVMGATGAGAEAKAVVFDTDAKAEAAGAVVDKDTVAEAKGMTHILTELSRRLSLAATVRRSPR